MAREANVVVADAPFGAELRASLQRAIDAGAREVRHEDWRAAPLPMRVARWLAYGLVRLAMGIAGYGRKDYSG
jgi:cardiolipin synthase